MIINYARVGLIAFALGAFGKMEAQGLAFRPAPPRHDIKIGNFKPFLLVPNLAMPTRPAPPAWCYNDLAFFCKLEFRLEKAARFPIKFRLGDVQYVERLEGKLGGF